MGELLNVFHPSRQMDGCIIHMAGKCVSACDTTGKDPVGHMFIKMETLLQSESSSIKEDEDET